MATTTFGVLTQEQKNRWAKTFYRAANLDFDEVTPQKRMELEGDYVLAYQAANGTHFPSRNLSKYSPGALKRMTTELVNRGYSEE